MKKELKLVLEVAQEYHFEIKFVENTEDFTIHFDKNSFFDSTDPSNDFWDELRLYFWSKGYDAGSVAHL